MAAQQQPVLFPGEESPVSTAISSQLDGCELQDLSEFQGSRPMFECLPPEVVWHCLLTYLSGKDVVRLSGVSRSFHAFFGGEDIFKILCKRDFEVSGSRSFRKAYKLLQVGLEIVQLHPSVKQILHWVLEDEFDVVPRDPCCLYLMCIQVLMPHLIIASPTIARGHALTSEWGMSSAVALYDWKNLIPDLPSWVIHDKLGGSQRLTRACYPEYCLSSVLPIATEYFGSIEAVQEKQMEILEENESRLLRYLPRLRPARKLKELVSQLCNLTLDEMRLVAFSIPLGAVGLAPEDFFTACQIDRARIAERSMQFAKECCLRHPVLIWYLMDMLHVRMDVADYIQACVEFEPLVAHHAVGRFNPTDILAAYDIVPYNIGAGMETLSKDTLLGVMKDGAVYSHGFELQVHVPN